MRVHLMDWVGCFSLLYIYTIDCHLRLPFAIAICIIYTSLVDTSLPLNCLLLE